jgi:hypothetical protein
MESLKMTALDKELNKSKDKPKVYIYINGIRTGWRFKLKGE